MRIVAVDWSGKFKRAEEFLWLAEVRDGHLIDLRSGLVTPRTCGAADRDGAR